MKKLLPWFLFAALLSSCIPVDDLGAYWDKGVIDTFLLGTWRQDGHFKDQSDSKPITIVDNKDSYRIDSPNEKEREQPGYKPTIARTLRVGGYLFFMEGPKKGNLIRYTLKKNVLETYSLKVSAMRALLKAKYPEVKNIEIDECAVCRTSDRNDDRYDDVRVKKLDDEVFKILSQVPDTEAYWTPANQFIRVH